MSTTPQARAAQVAAALRRRGRLAGKALAQRLRPRQGPPLTLFVAGVQRSGTNMVMDVLERSLETVVFHKRDPRAFRRYEMRPLDTIEALRGRCRARVMVVKALCELDLLPRLLEALAPARAVWIYRDWRHSVRSQLRSFPRHPGWIRRTLEDPAVGGWIGRGLQGPLLSEARALAAEAEMHDADSAALFSWFRNRLLFDLGLARDPRVRLVRYERLLEDPAGSFAALFAHAGLAFRPAWADGVRAPRHAQGAALAVSPPLAATCSALLARMEEAAA
ncbi:sulfotransferase family protein [Inmirania thermothiophila]|uniref:Sulfotransferase family protein n=1 Tax=Inmirania thermothiophila TaxID=1750597 RepID=A0A3N1XSK7_9GAMM|nr:sulfotransferase family protein [Inmirania thermothiophila]ROR29636.1 hypothetical protein EDC57_2307 [Inmirania thermothiophila]